MNGKKSTAGNSVLSVFTGNTGIIGVLVILCVVVALATDKFLTPSNIISVLRQISINTYIALGMTLIIILGHIDLAVGAIVAMSGTLTVGFVVNQGLPIGVAIAASLLSAAQLTKNSVVAMVETSIMEMRWASWIPIGIKRQKMAADGLL